MSSYILFDKDLASDIDIDRDRAFLIDTVLSLTRNHSQTSTDFAIEDGSTVSDGTIKNPKIITIDGFMQNGTGLNENNNESIAPEAAGRHTEFYNKCVDAVDTGKIVHFISDNRGVYINYLITSFSTTSTAEVGYGLPFSMTIKEIRTAHSKVTQTKSVTEQNAKDVTTARLFGRSGRSGRLSVIPASAEQAVKL